MSTLIVYATHHGTTKKCVDKISNILSGEIKVVNIKKENISKLDEYERIIIGGSIHAGSIQKNIKKFYESNLEILKNKQLGLFICCMDKHKAQEQLEASYSDDLMSTAKAKAIFGGEFLFENMNFIERFFVKKIAKTDKSIYNISDEIIKKFVMDFEA